MCTFSIDIHARHRHVSPISTFLPLLYQYSFDIGMEMVLDSYCNYILHLNEYVHDVGMYNYVTCLKLYYE